MDKDKMDLALSIARSYYQYHVPVREIMAKMSISSTSEHAQAMGHLCPKLGESMPKPWGHDAQAVGTQCPRLGQTLLIRISVD